MAFEPGSAEALIAERAELAVRRRVILDGHLILHTAKSGGPGAALFEGPRGKFRASDLLTNLWRDAYFWDVKCTGGADDLRKLNVLRHGIDRDCWEDYNAIEQRFKLPGGLALVELCRTRGEFNRARASGKFPRPRLLIASLAHLRACLERGDMHFGPPSEQFPSGSVNWDVADFHDCGEIDVGNIAEFARRIRLNLHPWERANRFGHLPDVPTAQSFMLPFGRTQHELFDGYDAENDFAYSIDEAYRIVRERKAAGGPGWPKENEDPTSK